MKYTKKRFLVTPEQYDRIKRPAEPSYRIPHPDAKKAHQALARANDVLQSDSLPEFDKVMQHARQFQDYLHHLRNALTISKEDAYLGTGASSRGNLPQPTPPPPVAQPTPPPPVAQPTPPSPVAQPTPPPVIPQTQSAQTPPTPPTVVAATRGRLRRRKTPSKTKTTREIRDTPRRKFMANLQMETPPPTPSSPYGYNRLIEEVAPSDRGRAKKILDTLNQTNGFSWNSKTGAVRINKRRYADSHIKAILADAVANKRQLSTDEQFNLVSRMLQQ